MSIVVEWSIARLAYGSADRVSFSPDGKLQVDIRGQDDSSRASTSEVQVNVGYTQINLLTRAGKLNAEKPFNR
jgi:hypothetical protein